MAEPKTTEQFPLRMPFALREMIRESANRNRRSMNSEILIHLETALQQPETQKGEVTA